MRLSLIIIFLLIVVGAVLFVRKKASEKKAGKEQEDDEKTLAEKVKEAKSMVRSEAHLLDKTPIAGPSVLSTRNFDQYANETQIDELA